MARAEAQNTAGSLGDRLIKAWRNETVRGIAVQVIVVLAVVAFFWWIADNTARNLAERGIASGFGFLSQPAGFDISFTVIPYDLNTATHMDVLWVGITNTLVVSFISIVLATLLGVSLGVLRLSGNWLIEKLVSAYVEMIRNVPLLLQILFWYATLLALPNVRNSIDVGGVVFLNNRGLELPVPMPTPLFWLTAAGFVAACLGAWLLARWAKARQMRTGRIFPIVPVSVGLIIGVPLVLFLLSGMPLEWDVPAKGRFNFAGGFTVPQSFTALLIALTLYTAGFIAEIVRAGIQSVSKGQSEAASALGLKPSRTMNLIVLPQALRVIVPPTTSQYLNITKNSSLGVAIGYPEVVSVFIGTSQNQTGQAVETIVIGMLFYLVISLLISLGMNIYNNAIQLKERSSGGWRDRLADLRRRFVSRSQEAGG